MNIQEILKTGWYSKEGPDALAKLVEAVLLATASPISTTKLVQVLLPGAGDNEFKKLTSLLWTIRQQADTKDFWAYTGKKTRFGQKAIHWLPLAKRRAVAKRDAEIASWSKEEF